MIVYGSTNKKLKKDMEIDDGIEVSEEYNSEDLSIIIRNNSVHISSKIKRNVYYFHDSEGIAFSTSFRHLFKVVKRVGKIKNNDINNDVLMFYLLYGAVTRKKTLINKIFRTEPFSSLEITNKDTSTTYNSPPVTEWKQSFDDTVEVVYRTLKNAIFSDLEHIKGEVAIPLSGGIDSGTLAYFAKELGFKVKCYNLAFQGYYSEKEQAKKTAKSLDVPIETINISPEELKPMYFEAIQLLDEPNPRTAFMATYHMFKNLAKDHITNVVSGDGGDEVFIGYWYEYWLWDQWKLLKFAKALSPIAVRFERLVPPLGKLRHLNKDFYTSAMYIRAHASPRDVTKLFPNYDFDPTIKNQIADSPQYEDKIQRQSYIYTKELARTWVMVDRNIADHFNLDLRTPYLKESVIQTFMNIPTNMKMHKKECKYVVKKMLRKYTEVPYSSTKVGFKHPALLLKRDKEFVNHFKTMEPGIEKLRRIARNVDQARSEFFAICISLLSWYENLCDNS